MAILWKKFTTKGAYLSIATGTILAIVLIFLSPTVWVDLLGHKEAIFNMKNPALISMPAAFIVGIIASIMDKEPSAEKIFEDEKLRTYLGVGAE
jgi:cation/acetate symporter